MDSNQCATSGSWCWENRLDPVGVLGVTAEKFENLLVTPAFIDDREASPSDNRIAACLTDEDHAQRDGWLAFDAVLLNEGFD